MSIREAFPDKVCILSFWIFVDDVGRRCFRRAISRLRRSFPACPAGLGPETGTRATYASVSRHGRRLQILSSRECGCLRRRAAGYVEQRHCGRDASGRESCTASAPTAVPGASQPCWPNRCQAKSTWRPGFWLPGASWLHSTRQPRARTLITQRLFIRATRRAAWRQPVSEARRTPAAATSQTPGRRLVQ